MATTIQSLERGLEVLSIIARSGRPVSLNEISQHFPIDRSSVFRLIATLVKNNFVIQDETTKRYSLGYRILELAGAFSEQSHIESVIRPVMRRILEKTQQNTHLAVLDGNEVVFIAVEQPKSTITMSASIGNREPAIVTALGRAYISLLDSKEQDDFINSTELRKYTPNTIVSKKKLRTLLVKFHNDKLAMDYEEYKHGVVCFAAPILDHRRKVIFSIGISGPKNIIEPQAESFSSIVRNAGIELSTLLGCPYD